MAIDWFLLVRSVTESGLLVWGLSNFLKRKYPFIAIHFILFISFYFSNIIGNHVISNIINVPQIAKIPLGLLSMIVVVQISFYGKFYKKIFAIFAIYVGMLTIDIFLVLATMLGSNKTLEELTTWYMKKPTAMFFSFYGMFLIYLKYFPALWSENRRSLKWSEQKGFILIPICQTLMLYGFVCCATITGDKRVFVILFIATLLTCFSAFFLFSSMEMVVRSVKIREQILHMEQKQQLQNEYYGIISDKVYEIKTQQHDMANHIQTIKALLNQGKQQELEQYVSEVEEKFERVKIKNYCENTIVNSVLCCKVEQAKKKGIDFHIDLHIKNTVPYETLDLSSLFSNLIDNAIENSLKSKGEKYIYLTDYEAGNLYTLKIINSKNEERIQTKGGNLLTSKEDADKHGYGTRIIQKIAEKYNGEVQFLDEGEIFRAIVLLQK